MVTPKGWVPGDVLVYFKKGITEEQIEKIIVNFGLTWKARGLKATSMQWVSVPEGTESEWIERFKELPEVESVWPNRTLVLN